ncbi:glutamate-rich protein 3 [Sorex araneus]|uniref:glutamate-rich protein 3 n=1 Tax=Sorex araneus TaxID=42254 RepID=UPI0024337C14|nr:glutamate-rich protein 3 [Sorex araneus]
MSHSHPSGLLAAYNSLTDKHLAGYFNNTRIRRHLLRSGLITRSGRILSEKEYKLNVMKRDHQKYVRECLAQAIFRKVLDMERYHQLEIKKKLENLARKERIQRFKGEHTRWSIEDNMPILSPHPPVGPKTNRGHSVLLNEGHSSPLTPTAPRPYTAPENIQPPIRLRPLPSNPAVGTVPKIIPGSKSKGSMLENEPPLSTGGKKAMMKFKNFTDNSQEMNSYLLPNINNYLVPIPPPSHPHGRKVTRENRPETWRRRQFRPTTATNDFEPNINAIGEPKRIHKIPLHSNATITMMYFGKNVRLSHYDHPDLRDEIKVYQQHCGGENLCVYKGKLLEKETFQFVSKRHHGFPFSLTFFLNGIQVNRLSSCCEFKHRKGSRLGGKRGYFGFVCVERSSPCYKCIIAMGLDKKASPLKPRREKSLEKREDLKKSDRKLRKVRELMKSKKNEIEGNRNAPAIYSVHEETTGIREVRTAVEELERKGKPGQDIWEDEQEHIFKYDYEEDFELDEEKQNVKTSRERQTSNQRNGMSESPSDDEKDHLDTEKENKTSSQKASNVNENGKNEDDECSVSEQEEDKHDIKTSSSTSSRSHSYSSGSDDESILAEEEVHDDNNRKGSFSSQELNENDDPEKFHLTIDKNTLKIEDQEIIKLDVDTKPLIIEENLENNLEEETEKITQITEENLSEKSREHVSKEEKEKEKSKFWKNSPAKVKNKKSVPSGVEKGVGQIISEALESSCHNHYDAESGVSLTDDGKHHLLKPETDTGSAPSKNLVVEESAAFSSNMESKQVASEMCILENEDAVQENEVFQHMAADTIEEKANAALWGKAGHNESLLGEWKPGAENPALAEEFIGGREIPQVIASDAEAEGVGSQFKDILSPKEKDSGGLEEDESPEQQELMQTVLETETVISEGGWGSENTILANKGIAQSSEPFQEDETLGEEAVLEMREAESGKDVHEEVPEKTNREDSEEEAATDRESGGPTGDLVSRRDEDSGEAKLESGEEIGQERQEVMGREKLLSISPSEKTQEPPVGSLKESHGQLCIEEGPREETETEAESHREDDREEMLPEELDVARERMKIERSEIPSVETESEGEEVTRASGGQDKDTLEEERKFKGEEDERVKEGSSEEETQDPSDKMESEAPMGTSQLTESVGYQGEDSLNERGVTIFEAGFEKSLKKATTPRREEEEKGLREDSDTGHQGRAELCLWETVTPPKQEAGSGSEDESVLDAPENEPEGKTKSPKGKVIATDEAHEAQECTVTRQYGFSGQEGRDKEGPLQGPQLVGVMTTTQEDVPEEYSMMVIKSSVEVVGGAEEKEEKAKEVDEKFQMGTGKVKKENQEGDGSFSEGVTEAEDLHQGGGATVAETATEKREVLADLKTVEEKTEANKASSFSDVAEEETWDTGGKTAAVERVAVEEIALREEEVPVEAEAPMTSAQGTGVGTLGESSDEEGNVPPLKQHQKGQEAETRPQAESAAEKTGTGCFDGWQESGAAVEFRSGLSKERELELNGESPQNEETLPTESNFTGTPEQRKHKVQRESDTTDLSLNNTKA